MPFTPQGEDSKSNMEHAGQDSARIGTDSSCFSQYNPYAIHQGMPIDNPPTPIIDSVSEIE